MAKESLKVNDLLGAPAQLDQFITNHSAAITAKGLAAATLRTTLTSSISSLQTKEQAQEDAKAALKAATQALDAEVASCYPEFSSMIDLLRGAVGNNTPAGKQLTNIRKLVTGSGGSGSSSSSSSSSGRSSSSSSSSS